jgi:hypothetical protein
VKIRESSLGLLVLLATAAPTGAEVLSLEGGTWAVEHELVLPGSPEIIYDAMTGDISGWWDHTFSENPRAFYIEAKPGGGFYEIFDESGDGVKHAEVIFARRGDMLRFRGPLGFSGYALDMVHTLTYAAEGESTRVSLRINAAGQDEEGWAEAAVLLGGKVADQIAWAARLTNCPCPLPPLNSPSSTITFPRSSTFSGAPFTVLPS